MKIECELIEKYKIEVIDEGGNNETLIYDDTAKGAYERYLKELYGHGYNGSNYDYIVNMEVVQVIIYNGHIVDYKTLDDSNLIYTFPKQDPTYWEELKRKLNDEMKERMRLYEEERARKIAEERRIDEQERKEWEERHDKAEYERLKKKFEGK